MSAQTAASRLRNAGDTFAFGVLVMLGINVLQRSVGLLRGVGLASFLSDVELGQWALANSFFIVAVPLAALGFPGSFGKFVEHFRTRDLLSAYITRAVSITLFGTCCACAAMLIFSEQFGWLVFGYIVPNYVLALCCVALCTAIAMSFVSELAVGFRQVQVVSVMQFTQSLTFAVLGLTLVGMYRTWWVLLPSFALANGLAMSWGLMRLRKLHGSEEVGKPSIDSSYVWKRVVPFACALWVMNLLSNLFDVADRYMLLHLSAGGQEFGQAAVGQYHCARIVPNLLISIGMMLGGIVMPYLSLDWEAKRFSAVATRIRQLIQGISVSFLAISIAVMAFAPLLFQFVIGGRYQLAESVLPLALAQATWLALYLCCESFLLCAERGKQLAIVLVFTLSLNLGLNWVLIQSYGLPGAIVATSLANVVSLALVFWQMSLAGCRLDRGTCILCATPLVLVGGMFAATAALVLLVVIAGRTDWLLKDGDRRQIDEMLQERLAPYGLRFGSIWPD